MHPLVTRIEPAGVAAHCNQAGGFLEANDLLSIDQTIGERDFHLYRFAGLQALNGLRDVERSGNAKDHGVYAGP